MFAMLVRAAVGAQPAEDDLDVVGLGPTRPRGGLRGARVDRGVEVGHRAAPAAGEVRVRVDARVEQRGRPAGVDAPHEAEALEELERGVDGRQRQAGQLRGRGARDLLGVGMAPELLEDAIEHDALARDAVAAGAQRGGETLFGGRRTHPRVILGHPNLKSFAIIRVMLSDVHTALSGWREASDRDRLLRVVQPALIGLIDGTISTLAPIFASAYVAGSHAALLVGVAAALGAAISMGMSEALSDDGALTGRGGALQRGLITGAATFVGGSLHALPFLIGDVHRALSVAYVVVACELVAIALVRKRYLKVSLASSLVQVTLGGVVVAAVGVAVGHA